ncbi:PEP-CTERM sorting domain-containing protein [Aestuariispira insulae]|uniref:Putative secreted protein with PEP-CTERM sorting signal n=1 Tax=Aestuariispira insulae TaxID=1461337 RepID=A0A3D9HK83_9PROT|nr:PEP-CTERM sorting domain-containing protein [Aestuariispira insulae]RED49874.1 putative secreted protein with PEP-CTERM sorting signal [Aestuariispira insulae]
MKTLTKFAIAAAALGAATFAQVANAAPILNFNLTQGGTVDIDTSNASDGTGAVGTNLAVDYVQDIANPITNGVLNFNTGAYEATNNYGSFVETVFGPVGNFTLTGTYNGFTGVLLSGTVASASLNQQFSFNGGLQRAWMDLGLVIDTVADVLLPLVGIDPNAPDFVPVTSKAGFESNNLTKDTDSAEPGATIADGSYSNQGGRLTVDVPEPMTLGLLGLGLVGLGMARRRKAA